MFDSFIEENFGDNTLACVFTILFGMSVFSLFFCGLKINLYEFQMMRHLRKKYPEKYEQYIKIKTWGKIYRILKENRFENDAFIFKIRKKVYQYDTLGIVCMYLTGLFLFLIFISISILQNDI